MDQEACRRMMNRELHDKRKNDVTLMLRELEQLIEDRPPSQHHVVFDCAVKLSNIMRERGKYRESLTLLKWYADSCCHIENSKSRLRAIQRAGREIWIVGIAIKRKRQNYKMEIYRLAIPALKTLLKIIEETGTEDTKDIALVQTWCCYFSAACHLYLGRYSTVCYYTNIGIKLMKDIFRDDFKKFRVVGLCHAITAEAWKNMKSYRYAITEYEQAFQVFDAAKDMGGELYRKSCINCTEANIKFLRQASGFDFLRKKSESHDMN